MTSYSEFRRGGLVKLQEAPRLILEGVGGKIFKATYRRGLKTDTYNIAVTPDLKKGVYQFGENNPITIHAISPEFWNIDPLVSPEPNSIRGLFGVFGKLVKSGAKKLKYLYNYVQDKSDHQTPYQEELHNRGKKMLDELESIIYSKPETEVDNLQQSQSYNDLLSSK
ncbi:MAG: hypothetical protein GOU98_04865 [Candidatus Altiarchaeota archaeon]|nr:hypothetical protein [Candidatus Altiarchaeota archaeon]